MLKIDSIEFDDEKMDNDRLNNYIRKPEDAVEIFVDVLKMDAQEEVVGMIALNRYDRLIGAVELMRGDNAFQKIGTDDLFYKALRLEAHSIILGYNKADGLKVSSDEYEFNKFLVQEAEKFRIEVYDNLIISGRDYIRIS
ncbi:JAB domain-containing protein [Halanaerobium congolense]|jgi:DNA repair protein RadC|uniref:RadC-like JAB domain-containing protein n=1 Tax=Halanaerobium congolense TaxID=54121 RepID=A0A1G6SBN3_9FIRM|nr:JAB domain-containing protein [Halanaerobium congolense]SDD13535.1 RadC-like JAB domain-containing protein [Halanaerobium congolense]SHN15590.1 RadC-like JAB domain-containing protein [Halanaerobium congolense]